MARLKGDKETWLNAAKLLRYSYDPKWNWTKKTIVATYEAMLTASRELTIKLEKRETELKKIMEEQDKLIKIQKEKIRALSDMGQTISSIGGLITHLGHP